MEACAGITYRQPLDNDWAHRTNVASAYIELGGHADPQKHGWNKDWHAQQ